MNYPVIPILVLTWNRLEYTKRSMNALLKTTYPFKLIVMDNGSTDGTQDWLLKNIPNIGATIIFHKENKGVTGSMNDYFNMTKDFKFISKVDNDTIVPPTWLSDLYDCMINNNLNIVGSSHSTFKDTFTHWTRKMRRKEYNGYNIIFNTIVGGSAILIRRDIIYKPIDVKKYGLINGFSYLQVNIHNQNSKNKIAFYDKVWVDLLDMDEKTGERKWDDYPEYNETIKKLRGWG